MPEEVDLFEGEEEAHCDSRGHGDEETLIDDECGGLNTEATD